MRRTFLTFLALLPVALQAQSIYNFIFRQDFQDDTPGLYDYSEWKADWNSPAYVNGLDKTYIVNTGNGNLAMQWNYPQGSVGPSQGGGQFEPPNNAQADEIYMSYNIKFRPGFDWVLGGKLPGLGGGPHTYYSGVEKPSWEDGFANGLMWGWGYAGQDTKGAIYFYTYHQDQYGLYGDSYRWGDFKFSTDPERWYNITIRMVMNTIRSDGSGGNYDGIMEGFVDGKLVYSKTGMRFRNVPTIHIDKMKMYSHFGGAGDEYGSARDEWVLIDDVCLFTYADGVNVPRGNTPSPPGRVLELPNMMSNSGTGGSTTGDSQAPAVPSGLHVTATTDNSASIAWSSSTDNVGVTGYHVYMDGIFNGTAPGTGYTIDKLEPGTTHSISLTAFDAAGNESARSAPLSVKTTGTSASDTQPPSIPAGFRINTLTDNSVGFAWNPSTDNTAVTGYHVFIDGILNGTTPGTGYTIAKLLPGTTHSITVTAFDAAGNESAGSAPLSFTTTGAPASDSQAPSVPSGLQVNQLTDNSISFTWNASTDNVAVTGYKIFIDGNFNGTTATTGYTLDNLSTGTNYSISIVAFDAAGNESSKSSVLQATTTATVTADTQAPSTPSGFRINTVTDNSVGFAWRASADNIAVTGYHVFIDGKLNGTTPGTGYTIDKLLPGSSHLITVTAFDEAGNESAPSSPLQVTTSGSPATDTQAPTVPSGLKVNQRTESSVSIIWNASVDNIGVTGYHVFIDGNLNGTATSAGYIIDKLLPGTTHSVTITAFDDAGNESLQSTALQASTISPVTNEGMLACWLVDNTGNDETDNNYDLALLNGTTFTSDHRQGTHALLLDGSDDFAVSPVINLGDQFTLTAWVKIPSGRVNIQTILANGPSGANSNGFKVMVNTYGTTDGKIAFESGDGSSYASTRTDAGVFEFDKWNHVAVTVNRLDGTVRIFYNGNDVTSMAGSHTSFNNNNHLRLGDMTNDLFAMKGELDEVEIYSKILSVQEIRDLMDGQQQAVTVNAPSELSCSQVDIGVHLTWKDNSDNETGFSVERSLSPDSGFSVIRDLASNQTSFTDNQVTVNNRYYYRIRAYISTTESPYSNTSSALVLTPVPATPGSLTTTGVTRNSIALKWSDNTTYEEGYRIERSLDALSGFNTIGYTGAGETAYTDTALTASTTYYYRIQAFNASGNSGWSDVLSVTTADPPLSISEMVAYWTADYTGKDETGNGHNLTLFSGAKYSSHSETGSGSIYLDGKDNFASSPYMDIGNKFTISLWVDIPKGRSGIQTIIANGNSGASSDGFKVLVNSYGTSDSRIIFESGDGSSFASTWTNTGTYIFNQWNHLAVTVDRTTGNVRLFFNGRDVTAISGRHLRFRTSAAVKLGTMANHIFYMKGNLDDVKIFNRVLSPEDIAEVINTSAMPDYKGFSENDNTDVWKGMDNDDGKPEGPYVVFPNPFINTLNITNTGEAEHIELIDLTGKVLQDIKLNGESVCTFNTDNLIPGVYMVRITGKDRSVSIKKVIRY